MADALCDDGYCFQLYFRNDPAPRKYLDQGLSPLLARTMALFDSLHDEYHHCGMDNLYNSAAFCRHAYNHKNKVLVHGVTRKWGRGIPDCVLQEEVKNKVAQIKVRGTVKAAKLIGDPGCPNLIASSIYDSRPVHYLSMVSKSIKWVTLERQVYNVESGAVETMQFLRLNQIHAYNHGMGDVDLADQLRGVYRLDRFVRNKKWWFSMLFFSTGVLLTNAYRVYLRVNEDEGVTGKKDGLLTHYEFRKAIALFWINDIEAQMTYGDAPAVNGPQSATSSLSGTDDFTIASSIASPSASKRSSKVSDSTLEERGALKCRLDWSLGHIAQEQKGPKARCPLHNWAGYRSERKILYCPPCNINLCIDCFPLFHKCPNLVGMKSYLKSHFEKSGAGLDHGKEAAKKRKR